MWIHLDLASLQGHWLSLGVDSWSSSNLPRTKLTTDCNNPQDQETNLAEKTSLHFPRRRDTHTHTFPKDGFRFIKDTNEKKYSEAILENGSRPPWEKLQTSPWKKGPLEEELLRGKLLVFRGVVWACVRLLYGHFFRKKLPSCNFHGTLMSPKYIWNRIGQPIYLSIYLSNESNG